jgi:hypothetical protein
MENMCFFLSRNICLVVNSNYDKKIINPNKLDQFTINREAYIIKGLVYFNKAHKVSSKSTQHNIVDEFWVKKDFQRDDAASREHHPNTEEL